MDENGVLNRETTSSVTASIILENTKEEAASWEFLKWWLSEETQINYARGMEGILVQLQDIQLQIYLHSLNYLGQLKI